MEYTWEQLHKMKVADLRAIAEKLNHPSLQGFSTMHKEVLVPALCHVMGIEDHAHHQVKGLDKTRIKQEIKKYKAERDEALRTKDKERLEKARHQIHILKGKLRRATV
ncbi:MAG: hypothetical protein EHM72_00925 [Calditrichaeota bacterium]|nr:MAG: hypothetical protein EHM72_00925 [Calditrichota bacterium]